MQEGLGRFRAGADADLLGRKDFVFDAHFLAEWRRRFPQAEVHRFADAGHYVLEDAGPEIIPLVRGFPGRGHRLPRPPVDIARHSTFVNIAAHLPAHGPAMSVPTAAVLPPVAQGRAHRRFAMPLHLQELDGESDRLAARVCSSRHLPRHADRADGPAGPRVLRPDLRPVQARRGRSS